MGIDGLVKLTKIREQAKRSCAGGAIGGESAMKKRRRGISDFKPDKFAHTPIPWFEEKDYSRMLEILNYPETMSRDYQRWRELAEDNERFSKRSRRGGGLVVRVAIDPDNFVAWCAAHSIKPSHSQIHAFVVKTMKWR
jgi:hypothetical protein